MNDPNLQKLALYITLGLLVGAVAGELFLGKSLSTGLLALIGIPIGSVFADKVSARLKAKEEQRAIEEQTQASAEAGQPQEAGIEEHKGGE